MPHTRITAAGAGVVRLTVIDVLLGQALSQATILWHEAEQSGRCESHAEELVELITAALVQLEHSHECIKGKHKRR